MISKVNDYLIESKLANEIEKFSHYNNYNFIGRQIRLNSNRRWAFDFGIEIGNRKILVEFDGDLHYTNSLSFYRDIQKNEIAELEGYEVIRIPYWVQLNTQTLEYYFKVKSKYYKIETNFPHGFISKKATLPGSFCNYGFGRFTNELQDLPYNIQINVISSILYQSKIRNIPIEFIANEVICMNEIYKKNIELIENYV